jgi:hypothetical protein
MDSTSCVTGAMIKNEYLKTIESVGFENVKVDDEKHYEPDLADDPDATVQIFNAKTNATETKKSVRTRRKGKAKDERNS